MVPGTVWPYNAFVPSALPRTRGEVVALLESRGLRLSKRHGQSFLVDPQLADAIVADAGVRADDYVVEIGPGAGALTQPLVAAAARVTSVEIDAGLHALLADHLGGDARLALVHGDCLEDGLHPAIRDAFAAARRDGRRAVVVANLPYSVGTEALARLVDLEPPPDAIVAMLQSEVFERLRAGVGTRDYGPLAVLAATAGRVESLRRVPPEVFFPRPTVESVVFKWTPGADRVEATTRRRAVELASAAFRQRRKTVGGTLKGVVSPEALRAAGIDASARPERIPPDAWVRLARSV
jgi:16S rRNA (adenine1518-N6/adenine1519-N6)-dimethyltransferase